MTIQEIGFWAILYLTIITVGFYLNFISSRSSFLSKKIITIIFLVIVGMIFFQMAINVDYFEKYALLYAIGGIALTFVSSIRAVQIIYEKFNNQYVVLLILSFFFCVPLYIIIKYFPGNEFIYFPKKLPIDIIGLPSLAIFANIGFYGIGIVKQVIMLKRANNASFKQNLFWMWVICYAFLIIFYLHIYFLNYYYYASIVAIIGYSISIMNILLRLN